MLDTRNTGLQVESAQHRNTAGRGNGTYSSKTSPPHPNLLMSTISGVTMAGTITIRARRVTTTVSVSPGRLGVPTGVDTGEDTGAEADEGKRGDGRARPLTPPVCDRDRRATPPSARSPSASACVVNSPGSASSAAAPLVTRRLVCGAPRRGCIRPISTSPNAPIIEESEVVDESRESVTATWRGTWTVAWRFSTAFPLLLALALP